MQNNLQVSGLGNSRRKTVIDKLVESKWKIDNELEKEWSHAIT